MKRSKLSLILMALIVFLVSMSLSFCSPRLEPGENPYGDDDPSVVGDDDYEDDDIYSYGTLITTDGVTQYHTIYGEGDVDYVKFDVSSGSNYRINLSEIVGFEPEITLFDTNGTTILKKKNTGTYYNTDYDWWGYDVDHNYSEDEFQSIMFTPSTSGRYYVSVKDIYDAHGKGSYKIKVSEIVEIGVITNLVAQADSQDFEINVTWGAISGVDGYYLYRTSITQDINNPTYGDFSLIRSLSGQSYVDTNISPDTTYYYFVKGYVGANIGEPSNVDSAEFVWATFKPTSSLINASEGQAGQITVELVREYDNSIINRYEVYRANNPGDDPATFISMGNLNSAGDTLTDTGVTPGVYYYYCVRIVTDSEQKSDYSWFDSGVAGN